MEQVDLKQDIAAQIAKNLNKPLAEITYADLKDYPDEQFVYAQDRVVAAAQVWMFSVVGDLFFVPESANAAIESAIEILIGSIPPGLLRNPGSRQKLFDILNRVPAHTFTYPHAIKDGIHLSVTEYVIGMFVSFLGELLEMGTADSEFAIIGIMIEAIANVGTVNFTENVVLYMHELGKKSRRKQQQPED